MLLQLKQPRLNVGRLSVYANPRGTLRDYVFACFELRTRNDFSWFEDTLECGRVPASESSG